MTSNTPPISPDGTIAKNDPGDVTASRYRYQWTWAAVMCCMLLDDTEEVDEVFCEQHEDVLIKYKDGTFTGQQVKTRDSDQDVWKTTDEGFRNSCIRFVKLEADYAGQFRSFQFLTNHPIHGASNSRGPTYVLSKIEEANSIADLESAVSRWLRGIAEDASCSEVIAFEALSKTRAKDDLPKLNDATVRLIDTLTDCWPTAAECSHDSVRRAAQALVEECGRASSLDHLQLLPAYLPATCEPDDQRIVELIKGKRMTKDRVLRVLEQSLNTTAILDGPIDSCVEPGGGSTDLMLRKLDTGGFSAVSRNSAEDLRNKADYLGIAWIKKHGREKGLKRYGHILSVVLSDAARAFETEQIEDGKFGAAMREDLRGRFRERRNQQENEVFECTDEHLEGFVYSLTAQCKVHWSTERPWEEG